jgi:hypothetical protein
MKIGITQPTIAPDMVGLSNVFALLKKALPNGTWYSSCRRAMIGTPSPSGDCLPSNSYSVRCNPWGG